MTPTKAKLKKLSFEPETLEAMRARLPEYLEACGVELRRNGTRLVGRCPVHDDRTPSFAVFGQRLETCGCYPCGHTGDVFATAQWLGKAGTFPEAVRHVAAVLGVYLPDGATGAATVPAKPQKRAPKPPPPPFKLSDAERERVTAARLRFCDVLHAEDPIAADIATSLGVSLETLRWASWGNSGLGLDSPAGLGKPWLCYTYPNGLKYRNPDPNGKPRFVWLCGRATAPWRMEWASKPEVETVYLTEGESDALALIETGIEADGTAACVASPGTSFSREWAPLFSGKRVVLCFDTDEPGRKATADVAAILKGHARKILTWKGNARHV
ncbi:MAG: CHC2 zinc finger domain-containing protein [Akkermansiaceae bacterium]